MDERAFTDLLRRHAGILHKVAYAYCREPGDREDVVQEIAQQIWLSRHRYDPRFSETTWVYRIAVNVAISHHRRQRRHREGHLSLDAHAITLTAPGTETDERLGALRRALDGLGAPDKALVLLYLDGHDHRTIGEVLGLSASNVGTRLLRIKNRLKADLAGEPAPTRPGEHDAAR